MTDTSKKHAAGESPTELSPVKRRSLLFWLLLAFILLLLAAIILLLQRRTLLDYFAETAAARQGYTLESQTRSFKTDSVDIENITLSKDGQLILEADRLHSTFHWRDVLKGHLRSLRLTGTDLTLTFDETGKIIGLPETGTGRSASLNIPAEGITLSKTRLTAVTPYGTIPGTVDVTLDALDDLHGTLTLPETVLTDTRHALTLSGSTTFSLKGTALTLTPDITLTDIAVPDLKVSKTVLRGSVTTDTAAPRQGHADMSVMSTGIVSDDFKADSLSATVTGRFSLPENSLPDLKGDWSVTVNEGIMTDTQRRENLAESLTLYTQLSDLSISRPFAGAIRRIPFDILSGTDLSGAGSFHVTKGDVNIQLRDALALTGPQHTVHLSPSETDPFFQYASQQNSLALAFDADIQGGTPIRLKGLKVDALSDTGREITGIRSFSTDFQMVKALRGVTDAGKPARLAPVKARITYARKDGADALNYVGNLDYDGDLPGGYVEGLNARGTLTVRFKDGAPEADFIPLHNAPVTIQRFETPTEWTAENLRFTVRDGRSAYRRLSRGSRVKTKLQNGAGRLLQKDEPADLDFTFVEADIGGHINDTVQDWSVILSGGRMTSDTLPSTGTDIRSPRLQAHVRLVPDKDVELSLNSPATKVATELLRSENLQVNVSGTPRKLHVEYGEGHVDFAATELPPLPMSGHITYHNDAWTGQAVTFLPGAGETPVQVDYRFANGHGDADIAIDNLAFTRRGLQPADLVPTLRGKITDVTGTVTARLNMGFGADEPLSSSGTVSLNNIALATAAGPLEGVNTDLTLSSVLPLVSSGRQTVTLANFDPGLPLADGRVDFEFIHEGIRVHEGAWPLGSGHIRLEPFDWIYTNNVNRMALRIDQVPISTLLKTDDPEKFNITGVMSGRLPLTLDGIQLLVDDGTLQVPDGGTITFKSPQTDAAAETNPYAGYAFDALKSLDYNNMELRINGPLDGLVELNMEFDGSNPDVLSGIPFLFRVGVEGELFNIARNLTMSGDAIAAQIVKDVKSQSD